MLLAFTRWLWSWFFIWKDSHCLYAYFVALTCVQWLPFLAAQILVIASWPCFATCLLNVVCLLIVLCLLACLPSCFLRWKHSCNLLPCILALSLASIHANCILAFSLSLSYAIFQFANQVSLPFTYLLLAVCSVVFLFITGKPSCTSLDFFLSIVLSDSCYLLGYLLTQKYCFNLLVIDLLRSYTCLLSCCCWPAFFLTGVVVRDSPSTPKGPRF